VYPEGTRQHGPTIQPLQPGAAYLAIRAGVPIVPVGIAGSEEILRTRASHVPRFQRVAIVVGEPIEPPAINGSVVKRDVVNELTDVLAKELQQTFDEALALRAH